MSESIRQALDIGNKVRPPALLYFIVHPNNRFFLTLGFYIDFYVRVCGQVDGIVKRFFPVRMEHIRFDYRFGQFSGYYFRACRWTKCSAWIAIGIQPTFIS